MEGGRSQRQENLAIQPFACKKQCTTWPQGQDLPRDWIFLDEKQEDPSTRKILAPCKLLSLGRSQYQGQKEQTWRQPGVQLLKVDSYSRSFPSSLQAKPKFLHVQQAKSCSVFQDLASARILLLPFKQPLIVLFRYIKIQCQTINITARLWGINSQLSLANIQQILVELKF